MVSVEGGEKPAVSVEMSASGSDPESSKDMSMTMQITIKVLDDSTIEMVGTGLVDGKSQAYSRTLTKDDAGTCKVVNASK
jgi:hypothetical protein